MEGWLPTCGWCGMLQLNYSFILLCKNVLNIYFVPASLVPHKGTENINMLFQPIFRASFHGRDRKVSSFDLFSVISRFMPVGPDIKFLCASLDVISNNLVCVEVAKSYKEGYSCSSDLLFSQAYQILKSTQGYF